MTNIGSTSISSWNILHPMSSTNPVSFMIYLSRSQPFLILSTKTLTGHHRLVLYCYNLIIMDFCLCLPSVYSQHTVRMILLGKIKIRDSPENSPMASYLTWSEVQSPQLPCPTRTHMITSPWLLLTPSPSFIMLYPHSQPFPDQSM